MITINANLKSIIGRIILLIGFIIIIYLIIDYGIPSVKNQDGGWFLYLLGSLLIVLLINVTISFFGVIKVQADKSAGQITLVKLFSKKTILNSEITGYYISVYNTKQGTSYGRIIKTSDNKIKELNPGNLKEVVKIDEYLKALPIKCLGEKRSFYPFTSGL